MLWSQHFQKYTRNNFQTGGRAPGAPALDPPLPPLNWMDNRTHITARIAKERQLLHPKKNRKKLKKKNEPIHFITEYENNFVPPKYKYETSVEEIKIFRSGCKESAVLLCS